MTEVVLNEPLSQLSLLIVYASMALLTLALMIFTFQLSRLASADAAERARTTGIERVGTWVLAIATTALGVAVVLRGIAANRVPWANMYEFSITGAFLVLLIYLTAMRIRDVRFIATFVSGFALLILGSAVTLFYVEVKTLMPALNSYWLVIHVIVAVLATAFFNIAAALHAAYLIKVSKKVQAAETGWLAPIKRIFNLFPTGEAIDRLAYRFNIVGFVLWSFTLIAGAIWAERAWHRYWGWDTKEVWTFIIWVLYAGYLHAKATRGWTGTRAAWLGLIAFTAVIFNFTVVNLFFKGLHVYSGL